MDFFKTIRVYSSFAKGTFKALSSYKANSPTYGTNRTINYDKCYLLSLDSYLQ